MSEGSHQLEDLLPVLPLKDTVVYPQIVVPLSVGRPRSLAAIDAAMESHQTFIAVAQKDQNSSVPGLDDIYEVGTLVKITRLESTDSGSQVIVQGDRRVVISKPSGQDLPSD